MDTINAGSLKAAVTRLREVIAAAPPPSYMQAAIQHLRDLQDDPETFRADMEDWFAATKHLPPGTVVVIEDGKFSLLTDDEGRLLSFR